MNAHADIQAIQAFELTEREVEVLQHIADGLENVEIGEIFDIHPNTVGNYMTIIREKLRAKSRHHAIAIAMRKEIIQ